MIEAPLPAWYVAFHDARRDLFWLRFLKAGFQHCFAFAWDADGGRWVIVNVAFDGGYVRALTDDAAGAMWGNLRALGARVLLARTENAGPRRPRLVGTCVTSVAAVLGLAAPCALTPFALYRTLLSRGAIQVLGESCDGRRFRRRQQAATRSRA